MIIRPADDVTSTPPRAKQWTLMDRCANVAAVVSTFRASRPRRSSSDHAMRLNGKVGRGNLRSLVVRGAVQRLIRR